MNDRRTLNLQVSWVEFRSRGDSVVMEVVGHTEADKAHQVNVTLSVEYLFRIIASIHTTVQAKQETLDRVRAALAGRAA